MVENILKKFEPKRENLLKILHELQNESPDNYLSLSDLKVVSNYLNLPESEVVGVATFYSMFSINKRTKHVIRVCRSAACHLKAPNLLSEIESIAAQYNDIFSIEKVECLGLCNHAPAMTIDNKPYVNLDKNKVDLILKEIAENGKNEGDEYKDIVLNENESLRLLNDIYNKNGNYIKEKIHSSVIKIIKTKNSAEILDMIKQSGLRGRGGAGFPTGLKLSFTAPLKGEKFIICNADEGEPGTFKDRFLMENCPHLILEGMILAGYSIGAQKGFIYIRGEYEKSIKNIQKTIDVFYKEGILGKNIKNNFSFDIEIKIGAGSYVVGEETALIESIEGKRGNPRFKPPFPAIKGLWQNPTVVNNVETLSNLPLIIENGADWFRSVGTQKSPGTKLFTLFGDVKKEGIIEAPLGITLKELIFNYGGGISNDKSFKAALVGGAAGGFLSEKYLDMTLDYDTLNNNGFMLGSGAILVFNEERSILDVLRNLMEFFSHESCGKCMPCRIGNPMILKLLNNKKKPTQKDWDLILKTAQMMRAMSLCPLGQSPILPLKTAFEQFKAELLGE